MMHLLAQFALSLFATLGFAVIFRIPVRHIPACALVGALGWVTYLVTDNTFNSPVVGCFVGACVVGLCSAIAAHFLKEAMTIFIIPGILCLVPGAKIYYTMEALLWSEISEMADVGVQTMLMAGAIAMGLLAIGSVISVVRALFSKTFSIRDKL